MKDNVSVEYPLTKLVTVLAAAGIASWSDAAAALAAVYSLLLICEWLWKRLGRPFAERRGWVKRRLKRAEDKYRNDTGD